ncbi:MAG: hypothetical protein EBQ65_06415, partial [Chitinophagaceae bacterium]|nr:hypothetical protein [Chitinophagaceae bacterium]
MKKNLFFNLLSSLCHILIFSSFLAGSLEVSGQSCQFQQGQNGGVGLPVVSPVQFERGNSNAAKSHFAEGFS